MTADNRQDRHTSSMTPDRRRDGHISSMTPDKRRDEQISSMAPINWRDEHIISKERIAFTDRELKIPGIRLFAAQRIQNAISPLVPHFHENAFEFTLVTKGSMSFYTGGKYYNVPGGSIFVSFPNEVHSTNHVPIAINNIYWFQVEVGSPENFLFLNRETGKRLIAELFSIDKHIIATDNKEIRRITEQAFQLCEEDGNRLQIAGYILIFFQLLVAFSKKPRYHRAPDIESVVAYIREHITEELFLDDLAKIGHLSTSQFKQKFCHIVGVPPRTYINERKVEYAKKLLLQGHSVTDTAMKLGFNNSSYFATVFKKHTMQTPREFVALHSDTPFTPPQDDFWGIFPIYLFWGYPRSLPILAQGYPGRRPPPPPPVLYPPSWHTLPGCG